MGREEFEETHNSPSLLKSSLLQNLPLSYYCPSSVPVPVPLLVFWATAVGTIGLFFFTLYYLAIGASSVSAFANITT